MHLGFKRVHIWRIYYTFDGCWLHCRGPIQCSRGIFSVPLLDDDGACPGSPSTLGKYRTCKVCHAKPLSRSFPWLKNTACFCGPWRNCCPASSRGCCSPLMMYLRGFHTWVCCSCIKGMIGTGGTSIVFALVHCPSTITNFKHSLQTSLLDLRAKAKKSFESSRLSHFWSDSIWSREHLSPQSVVMKK
jgi:hypothetical protein